MEIEKEIVDEEEAEVCEDLKEIQKQEMTQREFVKAKECIKTTDCHTVTNNTQQVRQNELK